MRWFVCSILLWWPITYEWVQLYWVGWCLNSCMHGCMAGSECTILSRALCSPTRDTDALSRIRRIISPSLFEVSKNQDPTYVSSSSLLWYRNENGVLLPLVRLTHLKRSKSHYSQVGDTPMPRCVIYMLIYSVSCLSQDKQALVYTHVL